MARMGQPRDIPSLANPVGLRHIGSIGSDGTPFADNLQPPSRPHPLRRGIDMSEPDPGSAERWTSFTETSAAGLRGVPLRLAEGDLVPTARRERFFRRRKGRLTGGSGSAYTAPPDAVPKQNGPGRTDFPRVRKVDLARAKVLDFLSKGNYESDY